MPPRTQMRALAALAVLLELIWIGWLRSSRTGAAAYLAWFGAAALFYLIALWVLTRAAAAGEDNKRDSKRLVRLVFWSAVVFRCTLLPLTPSLSHDLWRYRWDGLIQHNGFNPYQYTPQSNLYPALRAQALGAVPNAEVAAYRPPLAEFAFRWSYDALHGLRRMKTVYIAFDLALILLLARMLRKRGARPEWVLLYAWSPLAIAEIAGQGHMESMAAFFALLALFWAGRLPRWSAIVAALAALSQWYAALIAVVVLRATGKRWRGAVAWFAGLVVLLFLDFTFMERRFALATIMGNVKAWAVASPPVNASLFVVARNIGNPWLLVVLTVAASLGLALRGRLEPLRAGFVLLGAILLASPQLQPWMLVWILPFLVLFWEPAWLLLSLVVPLAYVLPQHPWLIWVEYVPFYAWLAWQSLRRPRQRSAAA